MEGWKIFRIQGSDNEIFQGGSDPEDTMITFRVEQSQETFGSLDPKIFPSY